MSEIPAKTVHPAGPGAQTGTIRSSPSRRRREALLACLGMVLLSLDLRAAVVAFAVLCLGSGTLGFASAPHLPWSWTTLSSLG